MSKTKSGGAAKNIHDSPGRRLGVKVFGGQPVRAGQIILRQRGASKVAGAGAFMSKDHTIHAKKDGIVKYMKTKVTRFSGHRVPRTKVTVE